MTDEAEQSIPSRGSHEPRVIERVARDMIAILRDGTCDDDEKDAAAETLVEAICPSPTLTDKEREAIDEACDEGRWYPKDYRHIHTLRGLLERSK